MKISTRWLVFSIVLGGYSTLIIPGLTLDKLDAALRWPDSSVQPPTKFVVHELVAAKLPPKKAGGRQRVLPLVLRKWLGPRVTDSSTEWSAETDTLWFEFLRAAGAVVIFSPAEPRGGMIEWIFAPATVQLSKAVVPEGRAVATLTVNCCPTLPRLAGEWQRRLESTPTSGSSTPIR